MINDLSGLEPSRVPSDAILVIEAWGANRNWLDPHDLVDLLRVSSSIAAAAFAAIRRPKDTHRDRDSSLLVDGLSIDIVSPHCPL
jgi:hypothetical protein